MFNIKLSEDKLTYPYKYNYYATIENYFNIKDRLEKQKKDNNKLKYKNKMLKEENNNLHILITKLSDKFDKTKKESDIEQFEFI
jgi:cell division protein FtsB